MVFVCYFLPCPPHRWHRGPYGQTTRRPHFLKRGFFVCYFLPCHPHRWHRGPYGQTTKKTHFLKRGFFVCYFLPCLHIGDIEARIWASHEKNTLSKTWFFRLFYFLPCPPDRWHIGPYRQTTKKPRFLKRGFSACYFLPCPHIGDIDARMGKPRKNSAFKNVVFSFVTSSLAPHIGDIEAVWANHEKTTLS